MVLGHGGKPKQQPDLTNLTKMKGHNQKGHNKLDTPFLQDHQFGVC